MVNRNKTFEHWALPRSWQRAEEHHFSELSCGTRQLKLLTVAICARFSVTDHYEEPKQSISDVFNRSAQIHSSVRKKTTLLIHQICYLGFVFLFFVPYKEPSHKICQQLSKDQNKYNDNSYIRIWKSGKLQNMLLVSNKIWGKLIQTHLNTVGAAVTF